MARVVDSVASGFLEKIKVKKVVTRTMEGAKRYQALVKKHGKLLPVPSIVVNGKLVFDKTPGEQTLAQYLSDILPHDPYKV